MKKATFYTKNTDLAIKNFPFSSTQTHKEFIYAIADVKEAAAFAHMKAGEMDKLIAQAIISSCHEIQSGFFDDNFFLPGIQGGAGTSIHMNVNEVIATRAEQHLENKGKFRKVHPNDIVNMGQSTNDIGPSALKIACIRLTKQLINTINEAEKVFEKKSKEFANIKKLGRTHLQDAVQTTLGEEFGSYAAVIERGNMRLKQALGYLYDLNLGGTAIGTSVNASKAYRKEVYKALKRITKLPIKEAKNLMSQTGSQTDFVMLSQALVAVMVDFSKIANDFRLLASGPNGGLAEIKLQELQPGSSIMPGKVNPVLPESINQTYFFVSGSNLTIEHAAQAAQLELGVMFPIIADRLIASLKLSNEVISAFVTNCVSSVVANESQCKENLEKSTACATLLTPKLGYETISKLVKEANANGKSFQTLVSHIT
jgi:aspartate ammonia-lyase